MNRSPQVYLDRALFYETIILILYLWGSVHENRTYGRSKLKIFDLVYITVFCDPVPAQRFCDCAQRTIPTRVKKGRMNMFDNQARKSATTNSFNSKSNYIIKYSTNCHFWFIMGP